ncbi:hemolysin family protein [Synechococcus sp. CS-602]|uniref:hemolysin family protein n=1 Tax=Synechococcaceae TaxID=1890426 RepID=UPI0008FF2346|nr:MULTISPECIES: hemolysin family protein [Synechococcaceae]MCT4364910.1 hemolysin family protein [Candidatus Regnicoccus frigidus MAG-AL1]APD49441.1 hemolysin [Synechococcus sp. SynAce01]MCT0203412.1 hemolysin family protein [Synechococcus sp. CS-603]MCT0204060.1 hemolysin family protein [Synechococcus sp. CS-602]MCT0246632.1 hemolysin family protein [Synechococcus sp. CS-601]
MRLFALLAALIALLAFFAAAEFAMIRLRPSRVQVLAAEGHPGAAAVDRLQKRLRRALLSTQLGAALALVALGWAGRGLAVRLDPQTGRPWIDVLVFLGLVCLATLLGGLLPKAWVMHNPEVSALRLAPVLESANRTLSPLLSLLERLADGLLKLLGLPRHWDALVPGLSAGELETLIESNSVTGLMPDERNILEGVFSLRDTPVREVMVPRSGMVTLPLDACFAEMMDAVHATHHARFPVIGDSLDDVRGLLDLRRLAEPIARGLLQGTTRLAPFISPVTSVQETTSLAELLPLIRSGQPLLLVVDEHGGTEGLVTVADLTGEIVGDEDNSQSGVADLQQIDADSWLVAGDLEVVELNRQLGLRLPEAEGHHTLAGFLLERLQHIPSRGESMRWKGDHFEISSMDGPRIERVLITRRAAEETAHEPNP